MSVARTDRPIFRSNLSSGVKKQTLMLVKGIGTAIKNHAEGKTAPPRLPAAAEFQRELVELLPVTVGQNDLFSSAENKRLSSEFRNGLAVLGNTHGL